MALDSKLSDAKQSHNSFGAVCFTAKYDSTKKIIYNDWAGFVNVEDVKKAALTGLELIQETKCAKILNDNSQLTGPWNKANDWIANVWTPKAIAAGLKYFAHIVSPNIFAAMSAENMLSKSEGFTMKIFESKEQALAWLREQPISS